VAYSCYFGPSSSSASISLSRPLSLFVVTRLTQCTELRQQLTEAQTYLDEFTLDREQVEEINRCALFFILPPTDCASAFVSLKKWQE
jgi:hypothetical protein